MAAVFRTCPAVPRWARPSTQQSIANAREALRDWVEVTIASGEAVPAPRALEDLRLDPEVTAALNSGASLAVVPLVRESKEEDISDRSRKDQRLLMEKLGALNPELGFGTIAALRKRIAHHYPDESAKQTAILNEAFKRSADLVDAYNEVLRYADERSFNNRLGLHAIELMSSRKGA